MKFRQTSSNECGSGVDRRLRAFRSRGGFTLAEVLAALVFMAIVIPVTVQAVRVAGLAGQVGERRAAAARIADRLMHERMAEGTLESGQQSGSVFEGAREFRWKVVSGAWPQEAMTEITMRVSFDVQGKEYDASVTTLIDPDAVSLAASQGGTSP